MVKTRTQQKQAEAKAAANPRAATELATQRRISEFMKSTRVPGGRVKWSPEVAVKGGSPKALNDALTILVDEAAPAAPKRSPGRPPNAQRLRGSNFRTSADLPTTPGSKASAAQSDRFVSTLAALQKAKSGVKSGLRDGPQQPPIFQEPPPTDNGNKGARSSLLESPKSTTGKRVRSASSDFYSPAQKRPHIDYDAVTDLDTTLVEQPRPLTVTQVSALFAELKKQLHQFAADNFGFDMEEPMDWPLHDLAEHYQPLLRISQFIADGSQYGWHNFFTMPESRSSLVYGIIGEHIRQHILAIPAFGLNQDDARLIENVDFEYLHYDAFTRVKRRASLLSDALSYDDWKNARATAVESLASQILDVLTPLLPPEIFSYDPTNRQYYLSETVQAEALRQDLQATLSTLLTKATSLSHSLILTGQNGSVVNIAPHIQKGEKWYGDYAAPQNCINPSMIHRTQAHGFPAIKKTRPFEETLTFGNGVADTDFDNDTKPYRPRVKMTCFPRVEIYVPHGPDREQLGQMHAQCISNGVSPASMPAVLPDSNTEIFPLVPEGVKDEYNRSKHGPWPEEEMGEMRMSYVDAYQHVSPHDVYLENHYVQETERDFVRKYQMKHAKPITNRHRRYARLKDVNGDPNSDNDSTFSSSSSSDSSSSNGDSDPSPNTKRRTRYRYLPGHSTSRARALYKTQTRQHNRNIINTDSLLGWRGAKPLPQQQRISLARAVEQARVAHASRSSLLFRGIGGRLRLAAHDRVQKVWNTLIAPRGTGIENLTFLLAVAVAVCWYRGLNVPEWVVNKLSALRSITVDDITTQLSAAQSALASYPEKTAELVAGLVEQARGANIGDVVPDALLLPSGGGGVESSSSVQTATPIIDPSPSSVFTYTNTPATDLLSSAIGSLAPVEEEVPRDSSLAAGLPSLVETAEVLARESSLAAAPSSSSSTPTIEKIVTKTVRSTKTTSTKTPSTKKTPNASPLRGVVPVTSDASSAATSASASASASASGAMASVKRYFDWRFN